MQNMNKLTTAINEFFYVSLTIRATVVMFIVRKCVILIWNMVPCIEQLICKAHTLNMFACSCDAYPFLKPHALCMCIWCLRDPVAGI